MSYDISLFLEEEELVTRNMTSNVALMWRHAGADLAEFHGERAGDLSLILRDAIAVMYRYPNTFRKMNPSNGWGDSVSCREFLSELLKDIEDYPDAVVHVSR